MCYDAWTTGFVNELSVPDTAQSGLDDIEDELEFAFVHGLYEPDPDPSWVEGMKAPWLRRDGPRALARAAVATNTNHTTEIRYDAIEARTYCRWGSDDAMMPIEYGERLCGDLDGRKVPSDRAYHWVVEDRPQAYRDCLAEALGHHRTDQRRR